ncbi:MAG: hypothetical protein D6702_12960 [Planctomycetota bacterium]|nr:MAG: hypothetical protein D6702_12960 [Planctomycetota bacterium]
MIEPGYYSETKYCPRCDQYVRYLQSIQACYCVECGSKVSLFSTADRKAFLAKLKKEKEARNPDRRQVS